MKCHKWIAFQSVFECTNIVFFISVVLLFHVKERIKERKKIVERKNNKRKKERN